uniref:Uncharacterized protein n=1 Tax=Amphiprion percula TaxID=161767 RepID=A0A3P8TKH1_AMPPE
LPQNLIIGMRMRKKESREVHKWSHKDKIIGLNAKLYHKQQHWEKNWLFLYKSYLLDREGHSCAKVLSSMIKQKRKENDIWEVPLLKVHAPGGQKCLKLSERVLLSHCGNFLLIYFCLTVPNRACTQLLP